MSRVELRERCRDSPLRARSFWTVRAAISSARRSVRPCCFWLRLTCSYWRARLVPFFTPRGGMGTLLSSALLGATRRVRAETGSAEQREGAAASQRVDPVLDAGAHLLVLGFDVVVVAGALGIVVDLDRGLECGAYLGWQG